MRSGPGAETNSWNDGLNLVDVALGLKIRTFETRLRVRSVEGQPETNEVGARHQVPKDSIIAAATLPVPSPSLIVMTNGVPECGGTARNGP